MVAFVRLGDELIDFAVRDLGQNAIALADGQQNRIQHGVDAAHDLCVCALELLRFAAIRKLSFFGGFDQPRQLLLQSLGHNGHVVDRDLHLLVVAFVGLGDELVDLTVRDLSQNAIALADGQQNRVQHFVDALNDLAMKIVELGCPAALGEPSLLGRVHQPHDLLQHKYRIVVGWMRLDTRASVGCVPILAISIPGAMQLPVLVDQCR